MSNKLNVLSKISGLAALSLLCLVSCRTKNRENSYSGTCFQDKLYVGSTQIIPGKLQCEYYDMGGEGIAFHDSDTINSGSGGLNKADGSYLHEFRSNEAVDISYTKFQDPAIDNSPYNFVETHRDQLYVGWTKPGEWIKYSVKVQKSGKYKVGLMYTANKNAKISFAVNDKDVSGLVLIPSTFVAEDTIAWRQWHHWNYIDNLLTVELQKGSQTFTIRTEEVGDMNYDFVNFKLVK